MSATDTKEKKEIEVGDELLKEIADQVREGFDMAEITKNIAEEIGAEIAEKAVEAYIAKTEDSTKKNISDPADTKGAKDPQKKASAEHEFDKLSPQMRFFNAAKALSSGNYAELQKYNAYAVQKFNEVSKAAGGYASEAVAADGQVLVPDPEFNTTVFNNLPKYGVAFREATVRNTDRTQVYALSLDAGLTMYNTAEAGVKKSSVLTFSRKLTALLKYAVIVPSTDELTQDAIVDFWAIVTNEVSRAYAKAVDDLVFNDTTAGILHTSGIITQPVSGAGTTITWDDLLKAEGATEDDLDESNAKWYMRKETWFRLIQTKGTTNDAYLIGSLADGWSPNPNQPMTPWGTPIVFTRVLPSSKSVGSNAGFAVYGDLKNYLVYNKNGMEITMLREATIKDANNTDFNLATQDGTAMRAVVRFLGVLPKGNASKFVVVGTGTVS